MLKLATVFLTGVLVALVALMTACNSPSAPPNVTEVSITATDRGCTPAVFDTRQGYIVYVNLQNTSTTEVSFVYPGGPYTFSAPAGQTVRGNFTSPTVTGDYPFQCGPTGSNNMTTGHMRVK
ncbi:MAG: cupredoxin domain-containing protein [Anaerolineae bacterium]|nr:cupredoxin domain-containing protein [Anaerolineae bacterium]